MRILIVSDTHRKNDNYLKVIEKVSPVDMVIHCGDIEGSEYTITEAAKCPVLCVLGNNDYFSQLPRDLEVTIGKYKVWITHGHQYGVSFSDQSIKDEAKARGADIVIYGHSHRPIIDMEDEHVIAINPGSLTYPRQEGRKPSFILMEIDQAGIAHFTINYLD